MLTGQEGFDMVIRCAEIATLAHQGQFCRDGVTPYIEHPRRVACRLTTFDEKCVAWLHDVIEDANLHGYRLNDKGVPAYITNAVIDLTKFPSDPLEVYYERIKKNPLAKAVKIQDMLHNLSDNPTKKQVIKYSKGLLFLLED